MRAVADEIVVNEDGAVESAKAVSGHPLLQQAAVDAAKEWRFTPTRVSGDPVKVSGKISFVFAFTGGEETPEGMTFMRTREPGPAREGEAPRYA